MSSYPVTPDCRSRPGEESVEYLHRSFPRVGLSHILNEIGLFHSVREP